MLLVDPKNPRAVAIAAELQALLGDAVLPRDLCIPVGGDGWMLTTMHERGPNPVYFGVNAGRLGFLLNDVGNGGPPLARVAEALRAGHWEEHHFPLLEMEALSLETDQPVIAGALNDVFVERISGRTALLEVKVGGTTVVEQLACDGLIVATALGSTAYSFSAGGVPSHPMAEALHVTPICAHAPRLSPFILPRQEVVEIEVIRENSRPVRAFSDGIDRGPVKRVTVRPGSRQVKLAFLPGHDFTATMIRKILKA